MKKKAKFNKYWLIPLGSRLPSAFTISRLCTAALPGVVDAVRTQIIYFFNPPGEVVFQPSGETDLTIETAIVTARAEFLLTLTPQTTPTLTPTPGPTLPPTVTSTPLPKAVNSGGRYLR